MSLNRNTEEQDMHFLMTLSVDQLIELVQSNPEMHDYIVYLLKKMRAGLVEFAYDIFDDVIGDNYEDANKALAKFRLPARG
jgi:hypothetical protein